MSGALPGYRRENQDPRAENSRKIQEVESLFWCGKSESKRDVRKSTRKALGNFRSPDVFKLISEFAPHLFDLLQIRSEILVCFSLSLHLPLLSVLVLHGELQWAVSEKYSVQLLHCGETCVKSKEKEKRGGKESGRRE